MFSEILVGTLATLNILVSPFTTSPDQALYRYRLESDSKIRSQCVQGGRNRLSELWLKFEKPNHGSHFLAHLNAGFCLSQTGYRKLQLDFNLPLELLEISALLKIPVDQAYVVSQIPSTLQSGRTNRIKIVRAAIDGNLLPVEVSWLPENDQSPEYRPLKIALVLDDKELADVSGVNTQSLKWKYITVEHRHPLVPDTLQLTGRLAQIITSK